MPKWEEAPVIGDNDHKSRWESAPIIGDDSESVSPLTEKAVRETKAISAGERMKAVAEYPSWVTGRGEFAADAGGSSVPLVSRYSPAEKQEMEKDIKFLNTPLLPKEALPPFWYGIAAEKMGMPRTAGFLKGEAEAGSQITTPNNVTLAVPTMGAGSVFPAVVTKVGEVGLAAYFEAQALKQFPGQWKQFQSTTDPEEKWRLGTQMAAGIGLPLSVVYHAAAKGGTDASQIRTAKEMGVRGEGGEVGETSPLRQQGETAKEETSVPAQTEAVLEPLRGELQPPEANLLQPKQAPLFISPTQLAANIRAGKVRANLDPELITMLTRDEGSRVDLARQAQGRLKSAQELALEQQDKPVSTVEKTPVVSGEQKVGEENEVQKTRSEETLSPQPQGESVPRSGEKQEPISQGQQEAGGQSVGELRDQPSVQEISGAGSTPAPSGISDERLRAIYGDDAVIVGKGKGAQEWQKIGQADKRDPYAVLTKARQAGIAPPTDVPLLRAEHQRLLQKARNAYGTPEYPELAQRAADMANAIKGVAHGPASDIMRGLQDVDKPNYDSPADFDSIIRERMKRESTPEEQITFKAISDELRKADQETIKTASDAQNRLRKFSPKETISFDEAVNHIKEQIRDLTTDCEL
jgi:hypothetical protein